jgi:hypothetical protein
MISSFTRAATRPSLRNRRVLEIAAAAVIAAAIAACGSDVSTAPKAEDQPGVPLSWSANTPISADFETGIENISSHGGIYAAYLHGASLGSVGGMFQRIDATPFRGQRVKAVAWVDESFITDSGSFSVNIDAPGAQTRATVYITAPAGGIGTWHQVFVVFDVPANAVGLRLNAAMTGSGQVFFDDIALATVDASVPATTFTHSGTADSTTLVTLYTGAHATLLNADFEGGLAAGS